MVATLRNAGFANVQPTQLSVATLIKLHSVSVRHMRACKSSAGCSKCRNSHRLRLLLIDQLRREGLVQRCSVELLPEEDRTLFCNLAQAELLHGAPSKFWLLDLVSAVQATSAPAACVPSGLPPSAPRADFLASSVASEASSSHPSSPASPFHIEDLPPAPVAVRTPSVLFAGEQLRSLGLTSGGVVSVL